MWPRLFRRAGFLFYIFVFASAHGRAWSCLASFRRAAVASSFVRMVLHVPSAFVTLYAMHNLEVGRLCRSNRYCLSDAALASAFSRECMRSSIHSRSSRDRGSHNHQSSPSPLSTVSVCYQSDVDGRRIRFICICRWRMDVILMSDFAFVVAVVAFFLVRV